MRVAPPLKSFPQNLHLTYGLNVRAGVVLLAGDRHALPDWSHARRQLLGRLARLDVGLRRRSRGKASTADGLRLTSVDDFDTGVRQCRHWRARQQAALVLFASVAADRVHRAGRHGSAGHRRLSSWSWSLDHSFWRDARYAAMYSSL